jgi:hypothetical protein
MARVIPVISPFLNSKMFTNLYARSISNLPIAKDNYSYESLLVRMLITSFQISESKINYLNINFFFGHLDYYNNRKLFKSKIDIISNLQQELVLNISTIYNNPLDPTLETAIVINDSIKLVQHNNRQFGYRCIFWISTNAAKELLLNNILNGTTTKKITVNESQIILGNHFENFVLNNFGDTLFEITLAESIKVHDIEDIYLSRLVVK